MRTYKYDCGMAGKILRVNLSTKQISTEDTAKYAERFIGGRAINSFILLNEMNPQTKWSDPENLLIFGSGPLEGTLVPAACRVSIDTKNPYSGGKGSANGGGSWGPELKYAGFDHVVIAGKAENPVYLWIHDGEAEIRDASSVWGKTTYETEEILRRELGDEKVEIASIGPAGENLVRGAMIIMDCAKVAGGAGVGCVMGSKKLKALAVRGHGVVRVAHPDKLFAAYEKALEKIEASPTGKAFRHGLIGAFMGPEARFWDVLCTIRNAQDEYWPKEKRKSLSDKYEGVPSYAKKYIACFSCPTGCVPYQEIEEGRYKGTKGSGYWINSMWYSQRYDVSDPAPSLKFHLQANQLGLDGDMATVVGSWAFECYEKGLLTKEDTDGLELTWGNGDAMVKLAEKIAYREGIGDLLAEGVKEASRKLGKGSEKFALHVKGQDTLEPYRIVKGFALGSATSPCGPRHLRGVVIDPESTCQGYRDFADTGYEGVPEAVYWQTIAGEIENMLIICNYMGTWTGPHALVPSDFVALTNAVTGLDLTEEEFMFLGKRSFNLEKAFNTLHAGFDRKDDYPPRRYMEEPVKSGPFAGEVTKKEDFDKMLDKLYGYHGWDVKTGLQTRKGLTDLGLEDIAEKLEKAGKLID